VLKNGYVISILYLILLCIGLPANCLDFWHASNSLRGIVHLSIYMYKPALAQTEAECLYNADDFHFMCIQAPCNFLLYSVPGAWRHARSVFCCEYRRIVNKVVETSVWYCEQVYTTSPSRMQLTTLFAAAAAVRHVMKNQEWLETRNASIELSQSTLAIQLLEEADCSTPRFLTCAAPKATVHSPPVFFKSYKFYDLISSAARIACTHIRIWQPVGWIAIKEHY